MSQPRQFSVAEHNELITIAAEAYVFAYAPLCNYRTLFQQTQDVSFPGYIGGFGKFRHYARGFRPEDTDIVTPSNDTPYSWAWLDLRAEPVVLSVPAIPARYYVLQWFDMYTHNFAYVGSRATGDQAGTYLFAGPSWDGDTPSGITGVFRSETEIIGTLTRTAWTGPEEREELREVQRQYRLTALSEFAGTRPPAPAPAVSFPAWDDARVQTLEFISYLNAILRFCPELPAETEMRQRFVRIGIGAGRPFDSTTLDPVVRAAITDGIAQGRSEIEASMVAGLNSAEYFGTRTFLGKDFTLKRAIAAAMGIYGNSKEEAVYIPWQIDADGRALEGRNHYLLHFTAEQMPPVQFFWSLTMYNLPQRLLVNNPLDRYSIGSRTTGLAAEADGSVTIYIQAESPGEGKESNWLPSPASGSFYMVLRMYGPEVSLLDGSWVAPQPRRQA